MLLLSNAWRVPAAKSGRVWKLTLFRSRGLKTLAKHLIRSQGPPMRERTSGSAAAAPYDLIYAGAQGLLCHPLSLTHMSDMCVTEVVHVYDLCCQLYVTSVKNTMSTGD